MNPLNINLDTPVAPARPSFAEVEPGVVEFAIDNSTLEKFAVCPKSAEYYVVYRRERGGSSALPFGSAIHAGLEAYYLTNRDLDKAIAAYMDYIGRHPLPLGTWRTTDHGLEILQKYHKRYANDTLRPITTSDGKAVEIRFKLCLGEIDLDGPTELRYSRRTLLGPDVDLPDAPLSIRKIVVYWTGKIDLLAREYGELWVVDHKTTSILGQTFWDQFQFSPQTLGYTYASYQVFSERPAGAIINCLALREPTPSGKPIRFERQEFRYSHEHVEEWKNDTMTLTADFLSHLVRGNFPRARSWCIGKYGKCPYFDVCTSNPASRESILFSPSFSNVTWNPLTD